MIKIIKRCILNYDFLFFIVSNLYGLINGFKQVTINKNEVCIIEKNKKFILSYYTRVYAFDVIREFNYYTSSVEGILKHNLYEYNFSKPALHKIPNKNIDFYYTFLPEGIETNDIYLKYLDIKSGDYILDLEAYWGLSTYTFSKAVGDEGLVISVESDIQNFNALEKNVKNFNLKNVNIINCAIWSEDTELEFINDGNMGSAVSTLIDRYSNKTKINAFSLDSIVSKFNLAKVNAIKMDIEGSEYKVFTNLSQFINVYKPKFIIEIHKNNSGVIDCKFFEKIFAENNYSFEIRKQSEKGIFPLIFAYPKVN